MSRRPIFYGWIVVAASATVVCVAMGALFSLAVFLEPIEEAMGWSRTAISTIALLNWLAMGLGSFVWGALSDRFGSRIVAVIGGLLLGLGLVLSSQVTALWQLYVTFGAIVGFAVGAFYAPLSATATKWFTQRRGLAVALVSTGIGFGILIVSPLARLLINAFGWRGAMLAIGDLAWLVIVPVALLIRNAPGDMGVEAMGTSEGTGPRAVATPSEGTGPRAVATPSEGTGPRAVATPVPVPDFSVAEVLRAPQFWAIALTHFACCAAHSGPIFHMVTHAIDQGVPRLAAATVLGVSGFASILGRVGTGMLADRFGAKRTLLVGLFLQAVMVFLYLFARDLGTFYALATVFGIAYGGVMPLYALVTREYFGEKVMGTAYGAVFLISTIGMGLGSFAGGWLYDRVGTYAWLFMGSTLIGLAAVLLGMMFRAPRVFAVREEALPAR